jgi:hypothetical protein
MAARKKKAIKSGRAARELDQSLLEAARRERTAIACMQGLLANPGTTDTEAEDVARAAVNCADALLDELDDVEDEDDEEEYEDEDDEDDEDDEEG